MLYPEYENGTKEFDDMLLEQFKVKNTARKTGNKKETAFLDYFNDTRNLRLHFNEFWNPKSKIKKRRIRDKVTLLSEKGEVVNCLAP